MKNGVTTTEVINNSAKSKSHYDANAELFAALRSGDKSAREKIFTANVRLVALMLGRRKYLTNTGATDNDDLFQAGCVALLNAIDNFDNKSGRKFSTYATVAISHALSRAAFESQTIRPAYFANEIIGKYNKLIDAYYLENNEEPSIEYISEKLAAPIGRVKNAKTAYEIIILPMDADIKGCDGLHVSDTIADETAEIDFENLIDQMAVEKFMQPLNPRYKEIIRMLYQDELPLRKIAKKTLVSRTMVKNLETSALNLMRSAYETAMRGAPQD